MKNVACIIARVNSKRFPQKVLHEINGIKLIENIIRKVKKSLYTDVIYLCTSVDESDRILLDIAEQHDIKSFAGSKNSVVDRMFNVANIENADNLIRVTADNIFTDEVYLDIMLKHHQANLMDYTRTEYLPIGITAEVISTSSLRQCFQTIDPNFSQYMLLYMFQPRNYQCQVLIPPQKHQHCDWRLTIDTVEDWERTCKIIGEQSNILSYSEIISICEKRQIPHLIYHPSGSVKFPAGVCVGYKTFRCEMDLRIQQSHLIEVSEKDYEEMLYEQIL